MYEASIPDRYKYRVWSQEEQKYLDEDDITIETQGSANSVYELMTFFLGNTNEYLFEQCTGWRDWKNNLIHEKDIVQTVTGNFRFVVEWDNPDGRFVLYGLDGVNWWDFNASIPGFLARGVEVISNTHEYPEYSKLLEDSENE